MATVTMPQLGESVTEGTVLHWLKQPGETVALDDALCEIETEKVTAELPSPFAGTMGPQFVPEGEVAQVGVPLCEVIEAGSAVRQGPVTEPPAAMATPVAPDVAEPTTRVSTTPSSQSADRQPEPRGRFYSPAVLRLAREHGVSLDQVVGTGIGGRVRRKDVEAAIAAPAPPEASPPTIAAAAAAGRERRFRVVDFSPTRKTIAARMQRSMQEAPQAWTMVETDVTGLLAQRTRERAAFEERQGHHLTILPYFVRAVCASLREFPALNARWSGEELRVYDDLDIGIAVSTDTGLVVPIIRQADRLSVEGLALAIDDLAARARGRQLRVEDIDGGTFTVNNTGAFGSVASKPIVNAPQVAIVTMERAVLRPVAIDESSIGLRWMMNVCLSFDHRAMDGSEAGGFLASLKQRLEQSPPGG